MDTQIEIVEVNGQKIPLTTTTHDNGQKEQTLILAKVDGGASLKIETLKALFRAGTNPIYTPHVREDGGIDLAGLELVIPGVRDKVRELTNSARKAKVPSEYKLTTDTKVCPTCGMPLGRHGISHLTQTHGGRLAYLESKWHVDGLITSEMYIDESLNPLWKEAGAKAEPAKKARREAAAAANGGVAPTTERALPIEDSLDDEVMAQIATMI